MQKNNSIRRKSTFIKSVRTSIISSALAAAVLLPGLAASDYTVLSDASVTQAQMTELAQYMDQDIMDAVYAKIGSCSAKDYLEEYCNLDPDFKRTIKEELKIILE